jgi:hypothetical protein
MPAGATACQDRTSLTSRKQCLTVIALFLSAVLFLLGAAPSALRYGYPALSLCVALFLFSRSRAHYIQFVFWLWLASPLLRRLVDYKVGFVLTNPLLLASFLATAVSGYVLLTRIRLLNRPTALPFACALAAIFFGTFVGLTRYPIMAVAQAVLNWLVPILFAFFLYAERDRYQEFKAAIERSLLFGSLAVGAYGIYQFFILPGWDKQWMIDLDAHPFGIPEPFHVRVFSTLNSPATCAAYMMTGLILLFSLKGRLKTLAAPAAFLTFLLTSSRSSWIGLLFGIAYLTLQLTSKARFRVIAGLLACIILMLAATQLPVIDDVVSTRLRSFTDPAKDVSYNERVSGHILGFERVLDEPMGEGMGSLDTDHKTGGADSSIGPHDSTILEALYALGIPGSILYGIGLLAFTMHMLTRRSQRTHEPFAISMRAIVIAFFGQMILNSILVGPFGFILWSAIGMTLAAGESTETTRVTSSHLGCHSVA